MKPCHCSELPDAFYVDAAPQAFDGTFSVVDSGEWVNLYHCSSCESLWAIDAWDKYSWQVAARISDISGWEAATEAQRKQLLLESRGGEDAAGCQWQGCSGRRVKGVHYCIDHLYSTGARK